MPNWCDNTVTLRHNDPAMIDRAESAFLRGEFLNEFVPVPEDLKITAGVLGNGEEQKELENQTAKNLNRHGYGNWYDFCVNEWGTKWDVGGDNALCERIDAQELHIGFESAWAPPVAAYTKLLSLDFEVVAHYHEPGMAFVGRWDNGDDECHEYSGSNSGTVRDLIGDYLDDYYGISENMAEWEDEDCDEVTRWYEDGVEETGLEPHKATQGK